MPAPQIGRPAVHLAEQYIAAFRAKRHIVDPDDLAVIDAYTRACLHTDPTLVPATTSDNTDLASFLTVDAIRALWQQHRIVYDFDRDMWNELGSTDLNTVIPAGLLTHLPHFNPFIALPDPVRVPIDPQRPDLGDTIVGGFFITGYLDPAQHDPHDQTRPLFTGSHTPEATGNLALTFIASLETPDHRPVRAPDGHPRLATLVVVLQHDPGQDQTVAQMAAATLSLALNQHAMNQAITTTLIPQAVSALVYLCATNADLRPVPKTVTARTHRNNGTRTPKPVRLVEVGHHVGATLRAWHQHTTSTTPGNATPRRPHLRRAHFHTFWAGQGRTIRRVRWLPPIPVNTTDDATQTTVIPVHPDNPDSGPTPSAPIPPGKTLTTRNGRGQG